MKPKLTLGQLVYIERQVFKKYDLYFNKAVKECNITRPEADILVFIKNNPYDTAIEIAKNGGFSKAYISKAICLLLKKDFISIKQDENDRRLQHLSLTEKSNEVLNKLLSAQNEFEKTITKGITEKEKENAQKFIEKILENTK